MIILLYFDWKGTHKELKEWADRIKKACEEDDIKYIGVYGPMNVKWHYAAMFESDSFDRFRSMAQNVPRPMNMTHYMNEVLFNTDI